MIFLLFEIVDWIASNQSREESRDLLQSQENESRHVSSEDPVIVTPFSMYSEEI